MYSEEPELYPSIPDMRQLTLEDITHRKRDNPLKLRLAYHALSERIENEFISTIYQLNNQEKPNNLSPEQFDQPACLEFVYRTVLKPPSHSLVYASTLVMFNQLLDIFNAHVASLYLEKPEQERDEATVHLKKFFGVKIQVDKLKTFSDDRELLKTLQLKFNEELINNDVSTIKTKLFLLNMLILARAIYHNALNYANDYKMELDAFLRERIGPSILFNKNKKWISSLLNYCISSNKDITLQLINWLRNQSRLGHHPSRCTETVIINKCFFYMAEKGRFKG